MKGLFWIQFKALFVKNWIVLSKHPILNLLRCLILPIAYGIFIAISPSLLTKPSNFGIGDPIPIYDLHHQIHDTKLIWVDATDGNSSPSPSEIMARLTSSFSPDQLNLVRQVDSPDELGAECPQNFNLRSECFAGIEFYDIPASGSAPIRYRIRGDANNLFVDVTGHSSLRETTLLPLQWTIDQAIIELKAGATPSTPQQWPYTQVTQEEYELNDRRSWIKTICDIVVLALFVAYIGIAYHLPGTVATERALLITPHMKAMGLLDSARMISWHLSLSLAYLPAWIVVSFIWRAKIFSGTNAGLILVIHLLTGWSLTSWSLFLTSPFGKSPQLAAVVTTFICLLFAVVAHIISNPSNGVAVIMSIIFPPSFYIFAIKAVCGFEYNVIPTNALEPDPDKGLRILPLIVAVIIAIFVWPYLAIVLEQALYDAPAAGSSWIPFKTAKKVIHNIPSGVAISIRHLNKTFKSSVFWPSKDSFTAVGDLSIDVPKNGIYVLLGSNGAGKSTTLSILGGLSTQTSGSVVYEGGVTRPPRGTLGIVPQKNVLFTELTCLQTLKVWRAVKWSPNSKADEDLEQLLRDCDLRLKINSNANTMSGGQKRKLQLAIGLLGGSKVVLVDECTSGVDPLSRRALWRTLTTFREDRTIIFTTHFLDEADLLADHIAILASPGKLLAEGSPVALKRDLGTGYSVQVSFHASSNDMEKSYDRTAAELLEEIRKHAPQVTSSPIMQNQIMYHLNVKEPAIVQRVLSALEDSRTTFGIASYDILGTTIEDVFLDQMVKHKVNMQSDDAVHLDSSPIHLDNGRKVSPLHQAWTIFYKRCLVARRSWLSPLLAILVAVLGATVPLILIEQPGLSCDELASRRPATWVSTTPIPLYLPDSDFVRLPVLASPPGILSVLEPDSEDIQTISIPDAATFVEAFRRNYTSIPLGGVSIDLESGDLLFAWEATTGQRGPVLLNLISNVLLNRALSAGSESTGAPVIIEAEYAHLPGASLVGAAALQWAIFFSLAMAVFPAFFTLYVSRERRSSIQAMQMSNGLTNPIGLWLGHLMWDTILVLVIASICVGTFTTSIVHFHALGLFWLVLVLYGISGALFAYCVSLVVSSPLASFAVVAGYQVVFFLLYLTGYLLAQTYAPASETESITTIIHFTMSLISPVASVLRAAFVSVNMFSLYCDGTEPVTAGTAGTITRFGGPILYLILQSFFLLGLLFWADSGSILPRKLTPRRSEAVSGEKEPGDDVKQEAENAARSSDLLRLLSVSKAFGGKKVVNDVSLTVPRDTVFALLGPNGAGKTTTFNLIRGDIIPDTGDIFIDGTSVISHPQSARVSLGVCPQFSAIDSQLTVRQHLRVYGRLKGLKPGDELERNVNDVMRGAALETYADRLASKLSGGNQRKLALAIAMMGNPSVLLIDEFSSGVDAKMKREMWQTLRNVIPGKAVVITTHSMEEASALANKVGILAKRLLAVGSSESLSSRFAMYEVHFVCRSREDVAQAQSLMASIPGARMADDVATRFEVPIDGRYNLAQLFHTLSGQGHFSEYTVERATLESIFMKVIRQNHVAEEDTEAQRSFWSWLK